MCDYTIPVFVIRLQRSKKETDVERFWYYRTKEDAEAAAKQLHGYKVSVERHWSRVPYDDLITSNKTRYPNIPNNN